jgi:hypothetical protein
MSVQQEQLRKVLLVQAQLTVEAAVVVVQAQQEQQSQRSVAVALVALDLVHL